MDYQTALNHVLGLTNYERLPRGAYTSAAFDLQRMRELLEQLGNPHIKQPTVHIAGTKGKGSTSAMIASGLAMSGYDTGLFISPHLHTMRERISINGIPITQDDFSSTVDAMWDSIELINTKIPESPITTFEALTALAFIYFSKENVEFQVLEVGLGGRLDATNVVEPEITIITSLSLDHTDILGDTLQEIAREKAGIIKPKVPIITADQQPEALAVLEEISENRSAPMVLIGRDVQFNRTDFNSEMQEVQISGQVLDRPFDHHVRIPLLGMHQLENAALAITALESLRIRGYPIPYDGIYHGLANVLWPGRLEELQKKPRIIIDGAHNIWSAKKLREAINEYYEYSSLHLIVGFSSDKDLTSMIKEWAPLSSTVISTRSRHPRSVDPEYIATEFENYGHPTQPIPNIDLALKEAMNRAKEDDIILVTGSLFVISEARESILGIEPELYVQ